MERDVILGRGGWRDGTPRQHARLSRYTSRESRLCLTMAVSIEPYQFEPERREDNNCSDSDSDSNIPETAGRANTRTWCLCGLCEIMVMDEESVCCCEVSNVKTVKSEQYQCVTLNPSFNRLIVDCEVLTMTRHNLSLKTKSRIKKRLLIADNPSNKTWRYTAYKQFVSWINAWTAIGYRKRVVIPSCVVNDIRKKFPEENGIYTGLKLTA